MYEYNVGHAGNSLSMMVYWYVGRVLVSLTFIYHITLHAILGLSVFRVKKFGPHDHHNL